MSPSCLIDIAALGTETRTPSRYQRIASSIFTAIKSLLKTRHTS
jgi:hypothetical protein